MLLKTEMVKAISSKRHHKMAAYNVGQDFQPRLVCLWYDILASMLD